jgi:hypothetical protein
MEMVKVTMQTLSVAKKVNEVFDTLQKRKVKVDIYAINDAVIQLMYLLEKVQEFDEQLREIRDMAEHKGKTEEKRRALGLSIGAYD